MALPPEETGGTWTTLPQVTEATPYFSVVNAIWPDLANQKVNIAPARNGMNRTTGKLMHGWDHVEQSMQVIFATPFHQRVLRRYVGSFVPQILGESGVPRIITRFFWAIASAIDLWEPNYRIKQVFLMGTALGSTWAPKLSTSSAAQLFRTGEIIFRTEGVYRPRAHLGDYSPAERRQAGLVGGGSELWDGAPVNVP